MSSRLAETLARLRVCRDAGLPVPPDLSDAAITCLERIVDASAMRAKRDALIRKAALLTAAESPYRRAQLLAVEAKALARLPARRRVADDAVPLEATPREFLRAAALHAELPASARQFYRVLKVACTDTSQAGAVSANASSIAP